MQFGAATPRRPQIDINVIPQEFRRRQFPVLTAGLALLLVGSLLLLYGVFYLKSYADLEITAFRTRVPAAQEAVRAATADEEAASQAAQRYSSQRADYRLLAERQVRWSNVLQAVSSPPAGVTIKEISQAGYTVSILGSAPEFSDAVRFLDSLRATELFSNSSIELVDSSLLTGTPTPRASYGTPTATRPAGAVGPILTPTASVQMTPTPSRTPTPTYTPNAAATATAKALWTATAKAAGTNTAVAAKTQTALARPANTATKTRVPTRTPVPPTATPITTMTLPIAASEVSEVGSTSSISGFGPDKAVDGNPSTAWVPNSVQTGNAGRWLQIDLSTSVWFSPGTDVVWSVGIIPNLHPVTGSPPASPKGRYFVYAYDTQGKSLKVDSSGRALPICDLKDADWTKATTCWTATSNANTPLEDVAVLDVGIPSSYSTDSSWLYGIAEVVVEVNQRGPAGAPAAAGPVGLGGVEAPGTATVIATITGTPTPTRTVFPTGTAYPQYPQVGTPTPTIPGLAVPTPPRPTPSVVPIPTTGPIPVPPGQTPAEFLILLEVKPGEGYK